MSTKTSKVILSLVAIILMILRRIFPQFEIDAIDIALLVIMILPWFSNLIKGMELPGGFRIEFRDLKEAGNKIIKEASKAEDGDIKSKEEIFVPQDDNANLVLVSLRIEIEKRIQKLISFYQIEDKSDIPSLLYKLKTNNVLSESELQGLRNIVIYGNRAAHGVSVDPRVIEWAKNEGYQILELLDSKIDLSSKRYPAAQAAPDKMRRDKRNGWA